MATFARATAVPVAHDAPRADVPARQAAGTVHDTVAWLHATGRLTDRQAGTAAWPAPASILDSLPGMAGTAQIEEALP